MSKQVKKSVNRTNVELSESSSEESEVETVPIKKAVKSVKTPTSESPEINDRVVIAKALNNYSNVSKEFTKALETWNQITTERVNEIIINIEVKKNEYDELINKKAKEYNDLMEQREKEYTKKESELEDKYKNKKQDLEQDYKMKSIEMEQQIKNTKIETEQKIKEFQIIACEEIATKNNYVLVSQNDYEKLQAELQSMKEKISEIESNFNDKLVEKIELEKNVLQDKLKQDTIAIDLNHKAEIAELNAQTKQQIKEIEFLNKLIVNLTNEVSEQRNLTKEIAKASSKAQITQSFNKD